MEITKVSLVIPGYCENGTVREICSKYKQSRDGIAQGNHHR